MLRLILWFEVLGFEVGADDHQDGVGRHVRAVEHDAAPEYSTDVLGHRQRPAARQDTGLTVVEAIGVARGGQIDVKGRQPPGNGLADTDLPAAVAHHHREAGMVAPSPCA